MWKVEEWNEKSKNFFDFSGNCWRFESEKDMEWEVEEFEIVDEWLVYFEQVTKATTRESYH